MDEDRELLRRYTAEKSEDAFARLVEQHLDLVYSVALREVRSHQLAEEVAQSVFVDLAGSAGRLQADTLLTAWLYQVARRTAVDVVRRESRRQAREQRAHQDPVMNAPANDWLEIEPLLDVAMGELEESDRAAVLLRYFENKSLREVGLKLGVSDDAAQKRVSRAVERLRDFFTKRGVSVGTSGLALAVSAHAVQAAPVGLAATIAASAVMAGAGVAAGAGAAVATAAPFTQVIAMNTLQKALLAAIVVAGFGTAIYETRRASNLRAQNQTFEEQASQWNAQVRHLEEEREGAAVRLATLIEENASLKSNAIEVLRLRGQLTALRASGTAPRTADSATAPVDLGNPRSALGQVELLKQLMAARPAKRIPEIQYLDDGRWLQLGRTANLGYLNLDTEEGIDRALCRVRDLAKEAFAFRLASALDAFGKANNGQLPADILSLKPFLNAQLDQSSPGATRGRPSPYTPPVDDAMLQRYRMVQGGSTGDLKPDQIVIEETAPVDARFDSLVQISLNGYTRTGTGENHTGGAGWWGPGAPSEADFAKERLEGELLSLRTILTPTQLQAYRQKKQEELNASAAAAKAGAEAQAILQELMMK